MPEKRLQAIVERIDQLLEYAIEKPLLFMKSHDDAENLAIQMLSLRAMAFGTSMEQLSWRDWLEGRYAHIPEPSRSICEATVLKYPHDAIARAQMYNDDIRVMVHELKKEMENG